MILFETANFIYTIEVLKSEIECEN